MGLLTVFALRRRRIPNPALDVRLFTIRRFSVATASILLCYGV